MQDDRKVGIICLAVVGGIALGAIIASSFGGVPDSVLDKVIPAMSAIATTAVGAIAGVIKGQVNRP